MNIFRNDLTPKEEEDFASWAQENFDPSKPASEVWHPVVRYTWYSLLEEHARVRKVQAQLEVEALLGEK